MSLWRHRSVRIGTGIVVVAALAGGGVAAYAAHGNGPDEYRTAAVAYGDVEQTLALSGTISPSGRADLSFGTAGTVASVKVGVGDQVTHGQVLAKLDTTALSAAVSKANAELAAAKAQLAKDEDAQDEAVTTSSTTSSSTPSKTSKTPSSTATPSSSSDPSGASSTSAALQKALAQLASQQKAVEAAQTQVDAAIGTATSATTTERNVCTASASPTPTPTDSASAGSGDGSGDGSDGGSDGGCTGAVQAVQEAQQAVADAEYAAPGNLKDALANLATTLTNAAKVAAQASTTPQGGASGKNGKSSQSGKNSKTSQLPTGTASQTSQDQSTGTSGTGGTGAALSRGSGQTVTAATLAKDQASIDSAKASLVKATQALAGATITAPASGTVAQLSLARGDSASAGSDAIVVISPGTTTVELSVSSTQVAQLEVGQQARVTPAGASQSYAGSLTRIGTLPSTGSTGSSTYPVTITLDQQDLGLLTGATAAVDVVLGTAKHVLTVPTSAVSSGSVEVYDDGTVSRARVTTGLVGRSRTVVTDGLKLGQRVVLADASSPLPSSDSNGTGGLGGPVRIGGGSAVVTFSGGGAGGFGGGNFTGRR